MSQIVQLFPCLGINKDLSLSEIPVGAVTAASNVRFRDGYAELILGQQDAYTTAPILPYSSFQASVADLPYWIVAGQQKIYAVAGSPAVWTNITRQTASVDVNYAATRDTLWNGGVINGVPIINNGVDTPQMWSPVSLGQKMQALTAWPANTTARVMRPFKNYMFAFDITESGTRFPHRVKWSHSAAPGTVPDSWDATNDAKDASEFDLDGAGHVIDAAPLRQSFLIYKENSTYSCDYVGGAFVFSFRQISSSSGLLSPDCVVEVDGVHYLITDNDVVRNDGGSIVSILDKATRRWLFKNIDSTKYTRCFVCKNIYFNEVWICFPELGAEACTQALIYNYKDGTTSIRTLPNALSAATGFVDQASADTWESDTESWQDDITAWDENEFGASKSRLLVCSETRNSQVLVDASGRSFSDYTQAYIERGGLHFGNPDKVKTATRLRPRINAANGTVLEFRLGSQMEIDGPTTWTEPIPYVTGTGTTVNGFASGKYISWSMQSVSSSSWRLEGMGIDISHRGNW